MKEFERLCLIIEAAVIHAKLNREILRRSTLATCIHRFAGRHSCLQEAAVSSFPSFLLSFLLPQRCLNYRPHYLPTQSTTHHPSQCLEFLLAAHHTALMGVGRRRPTAAALKDMAALKEDTLKDPINHKDQDTLKDPINHPHNRRDILRRGRPEAGGWCHCRLRKLQTSPSKRG